MTKQRAAITGIQGYVPDYILTNKELETYVDTNDEWIISRTGIKERRILKGEGKGSSDLGAEAVKGLLNSDKMTSSALDYVNPASGDSVLMTSIRCGKFEAVKMLLDYYIRPYILVQHVPSIIQVLFERCPHHLAHIRYY